MADRCDESSRPSEQAQKKQEAKDRPFHRIIHIGAFSLGKNFSFDHQVEVVTAPFLGEAQAILRSEAGQRSGFGRRPAWGRLSNDEAVDLSRAALTRVSAGRLPRLCAADIWQANAPTTIITSEIALGKGRWEGYAKLVLSGFKDPGRVEPYTRTSGAKGGVCAGEAYLFGMGTARPEGHGWAWIAKCSACSPGSQAVRPVSVVIPCVEIFRYFFCRTNQTTLALLRAGPTWEAALDENPIYLPKESGFEGKPGSHYHLTLDTSRSQRDREVALMLALRADIRQKLNQTLLAFAGDAGRGKPSQIKLGSIHDPAIDPGFTLRVHGKFVRSDPPIFLVTKITGARGLELGYQSASYHRKGEPATGEEVAEELKDANFQRQTAATSNEEKALDDESDSRAGQHARDLGWELDEEGSGKMLGDFDHKPVVHRAPRKVKYAGKKSPRPAPKEDAGSLNSASGSDEAAARQTAAQEKKEDQKKQAPGLPAGEPAWHYACRLVMELGALLLPIDGVVECADGQWAHPLLHLPAAEDDKAPASISNEWLRANPGRQVFAMRLRINKQHYYLFELQAFAKEAFASVFARTLTAREWGKADLRHFLNWVVACEGKFTQAGGLPRRPLPAGIGTRAFDHPGAPKDEEGDDGAQREAKHRERIRKHAAKIVTFLCSVR